MRTHVREIAAPAYEPVSLAQARLWCEVDDDITEDDWAITMLIKAMREYAEAKTGRTFIKRTFQLVAQGWGLVCVDGIEYLGFEIPNAPLISVESIKYLDSDGAEQTLATNLYTVHTFREPAIVVCAYEQSWPLVRLVPDAVRINYTAGYEPVGSPTDEAAHQAAMPEQLRTWMMARIATLFENREQIITGTVVAELPRHFADGLLDSLMLANRMFG